MNKSDLVAKIAEDAEITKAQATEALNTMIEAIRKTMKKGDKVSLVGFGTFSVSKRKARTGINPKTKEKIKIAARKVVRFRPGKDFSDYVN